MTLLVDNQLPLALARYLAANGWECAHVQDVGLDATDDRIIWQPVGWARFCAHAVT
jgi:predicted nuclease of predicted toxin-antitoxin system